MSFGGVLPKDTAENSLELQGVVAASDADVWAYGTYGTRPVRRSTASP
ncbi:hypothetical protein [Microbispora sp. NPDC049633]